MSLEQPSALKQGLAELRSYSVCWQLGDRQLQSPAASFTGEQVEGDTGLLKMGSKSLGKPGYTEWYESSLIKFHSSQSSLFLQTLQLQQMLFSSFQCDNNGAWH